MRSYGDRPARTARLQEERKRAVTASARSVRPSPATWQGCRAATVKAEPRIGLGGAEVREGRRELWATAMAKGCVEERKLERPEVIGMAAEPREGRSRRGSSRTSQPGAKVVVAGRVELQERAVIVVTYH